MWSAIIAFCKMLQIDRVGVFVRVWAAVLLPHIYNHRAFGLMRMLVLV
jgi:hypothetical protein